MVGWAFSLAMAGNFPAAKRIATKFRVRLSDLLGWNDLTKRSVIKPGQRLVMYVADQRAGI